MLAARDTPPGIPVESRLGPHAGVFGLYPSAVPKVKGNPGKIGPRFSIIAWGRRRTLNERNCGASRLVSTPILFRLVSDDPKGVEVAPLIMLV
jgi:hypothetical protein